MKRSDRRGLLAVAVLLQCITVLSGTAFAQGNGAPKVGGASTFDSPGANDTTHEGTRRPLSTLTAVPEDFSTLQLTPGFLLSLEVYDAPEFSSDLRIDPKGDVAVPLAGEVHVGGMTLTQAAAAIEQHLRDGQILKDPHVNLNVVQYTGQSVTVLGEVHTPGRVELLAPHSVADVLALAGGETEMAGNLIEIRHAAGVTPEQALLHYSRSTDDKTLVDNYVRPGDTVTVRRAGIVYVLGGVVRPGGYVMQEGGELTVSQALSLAYGTTLPAAVGSMRLIRKMPDGGVEEIPIHYRAMVNGKEPPLRLQAEDVVYVPLSKVKIVLSQGLLSATAQAAIYVYH